MVFPANIGPVQTVNGVIRLDGSGNYKRVSSAAKGHEVWSQEAELDDGLGLSSTSIQPELGRSETVSSRGTYSCGNAKVMRIAMIPSLMSKQKIS